MIKLFDCKIQGNAIHMQKGVIIAKKKETTINLQPSRYAR